MNCFLSLLLGSFTLGLCAWGSNIWPGVQNWRRAAVSRCIWWGLPFALIAVEQGASWDHALYLGSAAWLGAWIPHTDMPDIRTHWTTLLCDVAVAALRAGALLAAPAAVFWVCGAFWIAMIWAALSVVPVILAGNTLPCRWIGFATPRQVAGVLFGLTTGFCVAAAIAINVPTPDYLP